jgi:hypothetical protein
MIDYCNEVVKGPAKSRDGFQPQLGRQLSGNRTGQRKRELQMLDGNLDFLTLAVYPN